MLIVLVLTAASLLMISYLYSFVGCSESSDYPSLLNAALNVFLGRLAATLYCLGFPCPFVRTGALEHVM